IRQEMILGIGGIRALRVLGKTPVICHMNEGHSAFCGIERIRILMEENRLDFAAAREAVIAGTCFTTHTPVPAGNDAFAPQLVEHYFGGYIPSLKIDMQDFLALGRQNPRDHNEPFGMTVLALKLSNVANGVSKLHGSVSRKMWKAIWPELPEAEIPISSITNGIHTRSWLAQEMGQLYERYLGVQWEERPTDHSVWKRVENIPNAELWRTHERRRERLVAFARARLKEQLIRRGAPPAEVARGVDVWVNNPRRPLEASGTSGMKVCVNGGINMSILDGWWCEAYAGDNGWAIGAGEEYTDLTYQDDVESRAAYDLLEQEIVPLFY